MPLEVLPWYAQMKPIWRTLGSNHRLANLFTKIANIARCSALESALIAHRKTCLVCANTYTLQDLCRCRGQGGYLAKIFGTV